MAIEVRDDNLEHAKAVLAAIAAFEAQKLPLPTDEDGTCYLRDLEAAIDPAILAKLKPEGKHEAGKHESAGKRTPKAAPEAPKEEAPVVEPTPEPVAEPVVEAAPEPVAELVEEPVKAQTVAQHRSATRK